MKALLALQSRLPPLFNGTVSAGTNDQANEATFSSDIMQRLFSTSNITSLVFTIADSLTASVRRNPAKFADFLDQHPYSAPQYPETAYRTVPYIHIAWPWICLSAAVVVFANIFLVYAVIQTSRLRKGSQVGIWKSSQLPMLYHGFDSQTVTSVGARIGKSQSTEEMEEHARGFLVRLQMGNEGIKLSST